MTTLAPLIEKEEWEELEEMALWPKEGEDQDEEGEKGGPGPPRECTLSFPSLCLLQTFPLSFPLVHSFWRDWGKGDRKAPL